MDESRLPGDGERRLTAVETHMEHVLADLAEIKAAVQTIDGKLDHLDDRFPAKEPLEKRLRDLERTAARLPTWASMALGALIGIFSDLIANKLMR